MKLKSRRSRTLVQALQEPESEVKLNRRNRKRKEPKCKKYIYHHTVVPVCLQCGDYSGDCYDVEGRVNLCYKCFHKYFEIVDGEDKFSFITREKIPGIAEIFHKRWLRNFKEGGGEFANWNQTLTVFGRSEP